MRIRKQVYNLTLEDLDRYPVWQFALDEEGESGQDEATVRPFEHSNEADPAEGGLIVRAVFHFADGSIAQGYLTPGPSGSDLGLVQPIVVTAGGQVMFWLGSYPDDNDIAKSYARLGRTAAEVFPVSFKSAHPLKGGPVSGEVLGFARLDDFQTGQVSFMR